MRRPGPPRLRCAPTRVPCQALKEARTIREVVVERGFVSDGALTEEQLDAALDVLSMTRPN